MKFRYTGESDAGTRKDKGVLRVFAWIFLAAFFSFLFYAISGETEGAQSVLESVLLPDDLGNIMPDFSNAGYMGGGVPLPEVKTVIELSPMPEGDDRARIQAALDKIGRMEPDEDGFRGALLLKAGEYRVRGSLWIRESGVVLRGEGQSPRGTVIVATKRVAAPWGEKRPRHSLIFLGNPERATPALGFLEKGYRTVITDRRVPVGSKHLNVRSAEGFAVGDSIIIEVSPNMKWVEILGLQDRWHPRIYHRYERKITEIQGNRLTLDAPMVHFIDRDLFDTLFVWKYADNTRISRSGVENLRMVSSFNEDDLADESHALTGIHINRVRDCWVRNVTALHFQLSAVRVKRGARNVTVQDSAFLRPVAPIIGGRRYPFYVQGSRNLVQRCYARGARHALASSARSAGPNVFLDCLAEIHYSDIGPHQQWDTGYLYDNIMAPGGPINVQNVGGGHGWRGANQVFWNCLSAVMRCDEPPTGDRNWSIGAVTSRRPGRRKEKPGTWLSHGRRVKPRSLYLWQLEQRLGADAVKNVTVDVQRQDDINIIHDYLMSNLVELSEREKNDYVNLFLDSEFRTSGRGSPWEFRSRERGVAWAKVYTYLKDGVITRVENPVYGDDSALKIPPGSLTHMYSPAVKYPERAADKYKYALKFDYKALGEGVLTPIVDYVIIEYDSENTENRRQLEHFEGPSTKGGAVWKNYKFEFELTPELDKSEMPYLIEIRVTFAFTDRFAFANPLLEML